MSRYRIFLLLPLSFTVVVAQGQTFRTESTVGATSTASTQSEARSEVYGTGTGGMSRNDVAAQGGTGAAMATGGAGGVGLGGTGVGYGGTAGVVDSGNSAAGVVDSGNSQAGVGQSGNSLQGQSMTFSPTYNTKAADLGDVVPNMYAPPISAGSNPCAVGFSASVAFSGFGASGGGVFVDDECTTREWVRLLGEKLGKTTGSAMILKSAMCQSSQMWDALEVAAMEMNDAGYACKNERPGVVGRYVSLRAKDDLPRSFEIESRRQHPQGGTRAPRPARTGTRDGLSGFGGEYGGDSVGGGGFMH